MYIFKLNDKIKFNEAGNDCFFLFSPESQKTAQKVTKLSQSCTRRNGIIFSEINNMQKEQFDSFLQSKPDFREKDIPRYLDCCGEIERSIGISMDSAVEDEEVMLNSYMRIFDKSSFHKKALTAYYEFKNGTPFRFAK